MAASQGGSIFDTILIRTRYRNDHENGQRPRTRGSRKEVSIYCPRLRETRLNSQSSADAGNQWLMFSSPSMAAARSTPRGVSEPLLYHQIANSHLSLESPVFVELMSSSYSTPWVLELREKPDKGIRPPSTKVSRKKRLQPE